MIMGTLANLYAIKQNVSTKKVVNIIKVNDNVIPANIIPNELTKKQLKHKRKCIIIY